MQLQTSFPNSLHCPVRNICLYFINFQQRSYNTTRWFAVHFSALKNLGNTANKFSLKASLLFYSEIFQASRAKHELHVPSTHNSFVKKLTAQLKKNWSTTFSPPHKANKVYSTLHNNPSNTGQPMASKVHIADGTRWHRKDRVPITLS